jgi:hypothetical protein
MTTPTISRNALAMEPIKVQPGELLHVFKVRVPFNKYYLTDGRVCEFIKEPNSNYGAYYTNQQDIIDELNWQITKNHPLLFVDPEQVTIREDERDPEVRKRNAIIAGLIADGWVKSKPDNDMGNSVQGPLNATSTQSMAPVSAGGDGSSEVNRLAKLSAQLAEKSATKGKKVFTPPEAVDFVPPTKEEMEANRQAQGAIGGLDPRNLDAAPLPPEAV